MKSLIIVTVDKCSEDGLNKKNERERHVVCMGEIRNAYKSLVGKTQGTSLHGRLGVDGRISTVLF
jgi:hypothetical protein